MLTARGLEDFLTLTGWGFERIDERTLSSAFQGRMARFPFFIRLTPDWVFFTIVPFVTAPHGERALFPVYRRMLELNRQMTLAKLALDDDHDIVLTVELPTESAVDSALKDALDALAFNADAHYLELANLAANLTGR